jgi:hypothetical protein
MGMKREALPWGYTLSSKGPPLTSGNLSKEIDNVAKGWPGCLRALAAVCLLIPEAQKLILGWPLIIHTPHDLGGLLTQKGDYGCQITDCSNTRLSS